MENAFIGHTRGLLTASKSQAYKIVKILLSMAIPIHQKILSTYMQSRLSIENDPSRRDFLKRFTLCSAVVVSSSLRTALAQAAESSTFEIQKTDQEWKTILTPAQYKVLRRKGTEAPKSSPLNLEKRPGHYLCAGCALPLFSSETKYESGSGWPSFFDTLPDAIRTSADFHLFSRRTEVHCRRCGGHLGHVFDDGPAPTHKRYCMNGTAMTFKSDGEKS